MQQLLLSAPVVEGSPNNFPAKAYSIIYADPPWQYDDRKLNRGGADRHYQTQGDDWNLSLPVSQIAENDAVLFLWATWPKMPTALAVIDAWGFTYKTCAFDWAKRNKKTPSWFLGMGAYTRANTEPCLLATRGKGLKRRSAKVRQLIEAPVRNHSEKPPETRDRIVELFGDRPRIELFARTETPGWDCWGLPAGG